MELIMIELGLNNSSFSKALGVNPTVMYNIRKGRNMPSYPILLKMALSFDNIDMNWVVTGNGNMLREGGVKIEVSKEESTIEQHLLPSECEKCKLKDQIITLLKEHLETIKEQNQFLKEKSKAHE
jgi:DNA-binding XRE family transcriptional regulator